MLSDQSVQWAACAGTDFNLTYPNNPPFPWRFGSLTKTGTSISMSAHEMGPNPSATGDCQRALEVHINVIADVWACRLSIVNQGVDLAHAMIAALPR